MIICTAFYKFHITWSSLNSQNSYNLRLACNRLVTLTAMKFVGTSYRSNIHKNKNKFTVKLGKINVIGIERASLRTLSNFCCTKRSQGNDVCIFQGIILKSVSN